MARQILEEEKENLRILKRELIRFLSSLVVDYAYLDTIDERLSIYIKSCLSSPNEHNLYELLAIKRFFSMQEKYELRTLEVKQFILFYEFLKFPSEKGMSSFKLTPVQVFQFANIKGFYYKGTNRRVITEALFFVPRKFSKTTSVSSLAVEDLLYGDSNAQTFVASNSYDQAHICFSVIQNVLKNLDPKMRRFKVNREQVYNLTKGKTSFVRCLASNPSKLDGLNASVVIVDEYAQADSSELKNVLVSSMGMRVNPLTIIITTASAKSNTPFFETLESYKAVLRGELTMDNVFAHIFEPDVDDEEGDKHTWYKVQPHLGITCREEFYEQMWAKAQSSSDDMREFRNKLLNVFTKDKKEEWVTAKMIKERSLNVSRKSFKGVRCVVSVDLSVWDDFSSVTYLLFLPHRTNKEGKEQPFHSITDYYLPIDRLETHPNKALYKEWKENGYIKFCEGASIDYKRIANDIISAPFSVLGIGYDPYKSLEFVKMLECTPNVGKDYLYPVPQTYGAFTSPVECFELALLNHKISFEDNPITAYCFENAVLDEDRLENKKPIKCKKEDKIDGAITNIMCFWMMNNIKTIY